VDRRPSRRDLLTGWLSSLRKASPTRRGRGPDEVLRPPGALAPDEKFLEACSRCGDCVPVCPNECLTMVTIQDDDRLPAIDPALKPCVLCDNLPCIAACPDGALVDPGGPERVRIGIARVDPRRCVTFRGSSCDRCYQVCPYPDRAIMMIGGRPLVGSGACTGCGLCESVCPEEPKAIEIIAERSLVPGLRVPKSEYQAG
jgi:ferredoxin-type protein NapG